MSNPQRNPELARQDANEFVRSQFRTAWEAQEAGDDRRALHEFGLALHALQDSTSPMHHGFQLWTGNESWPDKIGHGYDERIDPGSGSELYRATQTAWDWYTRGSLPEGDLFIFGCDGCRP